MSTSTEEQAAWRAWLREMRWAYFATGTVTQPKPPSGLKAIVERWLEPLPKAYAAIGLQRGFEERYHVHILVGGVRRAEPTEAFLRGSWVRHGHVQLDGYRPSLGGVEYLVRQAEEIVWIGDPRPYRPRR